MGGRAELQEPVALMIREKFKRQNREASVPMQGTGADLSV